MGNAQIYNVEQQRIVTDTTGWAGRFGLSISASKFIQSAFSTNAYSYIQYKTKKDLYLFITNYDIVSGGGETFDNRAYAHLRYNRKINELVRWEYFFQIQYNSLTKIEQRILNGTGPRLKLSTYEKAKFYFGIAYMFEYEVTLEPEQINQDHRLSSYFTFTLLPEKGISLTNTTYIQPLIENFYDYRVSNDTSLSFAINKKLNFTTNLSFLYDDNPPEEVPNLNYFVRNGLSYNF
jgi:hypothetical protein